MKYNKSEIMKQAWNWFNNKNIEMSDLEWASYTMTAKTFANCLKTAWAKAKEFVAELEQEKITASKSEEVKAFNWAQKKLGVEINLTDVKKMNKVQSELEYFSYTISAFSAAMKVVKMIIANDNLKVA